MKFLVEACDPMEDPDHAYRIDGVAVSDFYTPDYFDDAPRPGVRYSFKGSLTRPREVKLNGYLSWLDPERGRMHQLRWFEHGPVLHELPDHTDALSAENICLRQFVDRHTITPRRKRV